MVDLPKAKVGIVSCSGEDLPQGTVTRLAALKVLEQLRPSATVTICLPLFLAGGEGDRAFARFYPTVAVDGCGVRCAARATEMFSARPAASVVVTDLVAAAGLPQPAGTRRLDEAGHQAVEVTSQRVAALVDDLLVQRWDRRAGDFANGLSTDASSAPTEAACSCGSGIPVQVVEVNGNVVRLLGLPLIFEQFRQDGKRPDPETARALLEQVRIYNPVPAADEAAYLAMLEREYAAHLRVHEAPS